MQRQTSRIKRLLQSRIPIHRRGTENTETQRKQEQISKDEERRAKSEKRTYRVPRTPKTTRQLCAHFSARQIPDRDGQCGHRSAAVGGDGRVRAAVVV